METCVTEVLQSGYVISLLALHNEIIYFVMHTKKVFFFNILFENDHENIIGLEDTEDPTIAPLIKIDNLMENP